MNRDKAVFIANIILGHSVVSHRETRNPSPDGLYCDARVMDTGRRCRVGMTGKLI